MYTLYRDTSEDRFLEAAPDSLSESGLDPNALLVDALADPDTKVRAAAFELLGEGEGFESLSGNLKEAALRSAMAAVDDPSVDTSQAASIIANCADRPEVRAKLVEILSSWEELLIVIAVQGLLPYTGEAKIREALVDCYYQECSSSVASYIVEALLTELADDSAREVVLCHLSHCDQKVVVALLNESGREDVRAEFNEVLDGAGDTIDQWKDAALQKLSGSGVNYHADATRRVLTEVIAFAAKAAT
ncbi:MAG: hypothetical protein KDD69_00630 [Bdellovibrionales bacterium]|nr:hypothetical protein [Bdellovibrionales bacterium]